MLSLLVLLAAPAHADDLRRPLVWFAAGAALDNVTTFANLRQGHVEQNPLLTWAHNDARTVAVASLAIDLTTAWLAPKLAHHHPRLARTLLYSWGTARLAAGTHNLAVH